ncbi:MAG TPA: CoA transferase, partial [Streptosporangiaceae bacterium]|nr:CoA transferase [Streptosporangiaceae bacterium]
GRRFADLAAVTGLTATFAELERLLGADFGADGDRYRHREVICALLEPWFADRTVAEVGRDLTGTSVLWSRYRRFTDLAADGTLAGNPLLAEIDQPGVGPLLAPGSPLAMDGAAGPRPAPALGADTGAVLTGLLGLSAEDVQALAERGIIGGSTLGTVALCGTAARRRVRRLYAGWQPGCSRRLMARKTDASLDRNRRADRPAARHSGGGPRVRRSRDHPGGR